MGERMLQRYVENQAYVAYLRAREIFEHRNQVEQFVVMSVGKPAADWDGVLRVEDVRRWRIVDNNCLS